MRSWWERQCQDSSSRKWNQFPFGFPEAVPHESSNSLLPASKEQRTAKPASLWHFTTRPWDTEHRGGKIKMCCPLFHPHSTKNLKRGYTAKDEDDGMSGEAWHRERNGKWKQGQDKRLSFPFAERINLTYKGHEKDDETGWGEVIWRHTETKRKQTELMWLAAPICKIFNSPENFHATHTFILSALPTAPSPPRYTHHVEHSHLWSCLAYWIFL